MPRPKASSLAQRIAVFWLVGGLLALCLAADAAASHDRAQPSSRPVNQTLPTISGLAQEGQTLSGSPGTWSGATPMTFSYAWTRCSNSGRKCSTISGAATQTYLVVSADVGQTLRVAVTARNASGSGTATSNPTAVVHPIALVVQKTGPGAAVSLVKSQSSVSGVYSDDGRIVCGTDCSDTSNANGRLVVQPYEYSRWGGWSGVCTTLYLDCDFASSPNTVSATAQFVDDGRTAEACDGVAPVGPPGSTHQITGGQGVAVTVDWASATRVAYSAWIGPTSSVYSTDSDGSCGLGSGPEKLFHNAVDSAANANAIVRSHQPGTVIAPDSLSQEASSGHFAVSPDSSKIAYSRTGFVHVADAATGGNDQLLGYQDANNYYATLARSKFIWSPDGSKIAFRGRVVSGGVIDDTHKMLILYPGQGSQGSIFDPGVPVCEVWKTNDSFYAIVNNPDAKLGAVDLQGNTTYFGLPNSSECPTSRSRGGKITRTTTFGPNYLIVSDSENNSIQATWQEDFSGPGVLSPDGSKIAWVDWNVDHTQLRLLVADANGGAPVAVFSSPQQATGLAWSPTGDQLAYTWGATAANRQVWVATPNPGEPTLLERFTPELRLDQQEVYHPDSAATITDSFGSGYSNVLRDGSGTVVAAADPTDPADDLSLSYLGTRDAAVNTGADYLDEADGTRSADAQRMHADPAYANKVYARSVPDGTGFLLQYWMFYYDNPKQFGVPPLTFGNHEGDWEMIQLQIDGAGNPTVATFSQHTAGETCNWSQVEHTSNDRPVVYVAQGSHANYFTPGDHLVPVNHFPDQLADQHDDADGAGDTVLPNVIDVSTPPAWMHWAGKWGQDGGSPPGPFYQSKWSDPVGFMTGADACGASG